MKKYKISIADIYRSGVVSVVRWEWEAATVPGALQLARSYHRPSIWVPTIIENKGDWEVIGYHLRLYYDGNIIFQFRCYKPEDGWRHRCLYADGAYADGGARSDD